MSQRKAETHPGFERADAHNRPILLLTGALLATCALAFWSMELLEDQLVETETTGDPHPLAAESAEIPPAPRLQVTAKVDLEALHQREDTLLGEYAWIDVEAGQLRVPIERAMDLVVAEGAPGGEQ